MGLTTETESPKVTYRTALRQLRFASIGLPQGDRNNVTPDLPVISAYAKRLEQAGFAAMIVTDGRGEAHQNRITIPHNLYEPLSLLSAVSTLTERIGLVATASTRLNEPFHLARRLASLDHFSGGRAGWNLLANTASHPSGGFFRTGNALNEDVIERATEFITIARGLWDSYAADAIVADKRSGIYFRQGSRRPLNHAGRYFRVAGPLNVSRSPQGHSVIFYTVSEIGDIDFAAEQADVVLMNVKSVSEARQFRDQLHDLLTNADRRHDSVQVWPVIVPFVGAAEGKVKPYLDRYSTSNEGLPIFGTSVQVADHLAEWLEAGVADGFAIRLPQFPADVDPFLDDVLPILQQRGLFAPAKGGTLREMIGLSRPKRNSK